MARALIDDCFAHQPERLTAAEALELLKARVGPVVERESVPLGAAYGRILAERLVSPRDVPASTTSPSTASRSPMPISRPTGRPASKLGPGAPPPAIPSRGVSHRARRSAC